MFCVVINCLIAGHREKKKDQYPVMNSKDQELKSLCVKLLESLNCSICQDVLKDARDLSCGHTYCLACLQELVAARGWTRTIQCCQCRKQTPIPAAGGVAALKQNYKLNCIIEEQGMILKKMNNAAATAAAAEAEPEVQIFVRDLEGKSQTIMIRPSETARELKRKVERKTGIPAQEMKLSFQSKPLDDKLTLGEHGLQLHSTLEMLLRLKGGAQGAL